MTIRDMEERIEWWEKEGKKEMDELVGKPNIENMLLMIDDIEFYIEKYGIGKIIKKDSDKAEVNFNNFGLKKIYLKFLQVKN